jgi:hypothetical protein
MAVAMSRLNSARARLMGGGPGVIGARAVSMDLFAYGKAFI